MTFKLPTYIWLVFCLPFANISFAQDEIASSFKEKKELSTDNNLINKMIDEVVKDYLIKKETQDSLIDSSSIKEKNYTALSRTFPGGSKDRELTMKLPTSGIGANLQVIDKIYGTTEKFEVMVNSKTSYDTVDIYLHSCFYQKEEYQRESIALVSIFDNLRGKIKLNGWLSTRYSHLTNFDNYRYSMWLLSCTKSDQE